MIKVRTVLVVGAGASVPYGFPTGPGLFESLTQIHFQQSRQGGSNFLLSRAAARVLEFGLSDIETLHAFTRRLTRSGVRSVDRFLERQGQSLVEVGKLVIAAELGHFESESNLYTNTRVSAGPWYHALWDWIETRPDRLRDNQLTIVTFNYDRSLEYFISQSLENLYDVPPAESLQLAARVRIIHVHGQLGRLCIDGENGGRPYNPPDSAEEVRRAAAGIQVISEVADESASFEEARVAIAEAERVHFLGFAYDPRSLARLGIGSIGRDGPTDFGGSVFGLTPSEIETVRLSFGNATFTPGDSRHNALDYLRHLRPLNR